MLGSQTSRQLGEPVEARVIYAAAEDFKLLEFRLDRAWRDRALRVLRVLQYYGNQKVKKNSKSSYADGNKWDYDWSYLSNTSTSCGLDTERDAKYYDDLYTDDNDYNTLWWYTNVTDANIRRLENFIGFGYKTEEFAEELGMLSYDFDTCDLDEILDQLGYINQP